MKMKRQICKMFIVLLITRISLPYWLIPDTPVLYWGIAGVLAYSWCNFDTGKQKDKRIILFVALLLSGSVFSAYMVQNGFLIDDKNFVLVVKLLSLIIFSILVLNCLYLLMDRLSCGCFIGKIDITRTGIDAKKLRGSVVFVFLCWLPYFLVYYPGLIMADSANSIYQALGIHEWSNHFPVVYSYIIKLCLLPGILSGNLNIGYAVYTLMQMAVMACVLGYTVCWIRNKGFSWYIVAMMSMYYGFSPCFPQHAVTMWKDGIFSVVLLYMSLQLFDLVISQGAVLQKKGFLRGSIIGAVVVCFFRNNGVYIVALICMGSAVYIVMNRKNNYREMIRYLLYHCIVVAVVFVITGPVYEASGIKKDEVEKYGILLQQMTRTVAEEGEIGEREYAFLDELLPIEKYKELYMPQLVDPVKWDAEFDNNFLEGNSEKFMLTWFNLLLKNPKIYVKAYLEMTYQYWVPNVWENNRYTSNILEGNPDAVIFEQQWKEAEVIYCNLLENKWIDMKHIFSITTPMAAVGLFVWLAVLIASYAVLKQKSVFILGLIPCFGNLATLLVATPAGYWPRYMLVIYYMFPIFFCMIPMIGKDDEEANR